MEDEPLLPALPSNSASASFLNDKPRKRARFSPPISSDPPIFSSDDDPSAENYTQGRRKQKYRGPWYRQRLAPDLESQQTHGAGLQKKSKRTFERQYDSGVFLGSDGTDVDEAAEGLESINETWSLPVRPSCATQTIEELPSLEALAQGQIELCLENGNETIDLS